MKNSFILACLLAMPFIGLGQVDTLRVLFLGNSYTAFNNLPLLCENMATSINKVLITDRNTPGGNTLDNHSTNTVSQQKIRQGNWDYVVLQEQSQIPTIPFYRDTLMYPGAFALNDSIKKYNPCAIVSFYMTWGRRNGGRQCDQNQTHCSPNFVDFNHMQDSLQTAYQRLADSLNTFVAPVGMAWKKVIQDTSIVLHTSDNSHPNYQGSYLAASVFHSVFWNTSPNVVSFHGNLNMSTASYLRSVADSIVFHSPEKWNLELRQPVARFISNVKNDTVRFSNQSSALLPATYSWNFGDGNFSSATNPTHIYRNSGTYTVSLRVDQCGKQDTLNQRINVLSTSVEERPSQSPIQAYPNPVKDLLFLEIPLGTKSSESELFNAAGILQERIPINQLPKQSIPVKHLKAGLYFLKIKDAEGKQIGLVKFQKL